MPKNGICHIEWAVTDFEKAKKFYGGLFGWKFTPFGGEYLLFQAEGCLGGGFCLTDKVTPSAYPAVYVEVESIEPYLDRAVQVGGSVHAKKTEIPTIGWYATLKDADGNFVGLFQSAR